LVFTFCHLGAWNSFIEAPISAYVKGESQKAHRNQAGREAALRNAFHFEYVKGKCFFIFSEFVVEIIKALRFGITKPPNRYVTIRERRAQGAATDGFRKMQAIKVKSDTDI
jgi:hypothetical protein